MASGSKRGLVSSRHYVRIIAGTVPRGKHAGRPVLYAYGYAAIAELAGVHESSVRKAATSRRGRAPALDMSDILSVAEYIKRNRKKKA